MRRDHSPIALSVNLNKIALIRNSRPGNNPDLLAYARKLLTAGANGLTVHPRPDQRHIRPEDCYQIKVMLEELNHNRDDSIIEFNIEGNPFAEFCTAPRDDFKNYPGFIEILAKAQPDQATLVPDSDSQLTSDHGFDLTGETTALEKIIAKIHRLGCRVSLFMDPDPEQIHRAKDIGADRIELYTGPYADAFTEALLSGNTSNVDRLFKQHVSAAEQAERLGLGVNAGHDLNLQNLSQYRQLPHLLEVSIGHALTIDSLELSSEKAIKAYCDILH
ncbi:MAG: pyridoxine 5'-phosphate synthase [Cellvibrionales bacterium]|nr:pyridoxine 5'-phosphate synthase [Cellvibrionales bacterium]|tara:strand:- start:17118 stop:17942 length:825 start_codon:yes stop_codon:yes gene_type:complete